MPTVRQTKSESLAVLRRYVELGANFLDTAEIYGPYKNEELLGRFLREASRERLVIATKVRFSDRGRRKQRDGQLACRTFERRCEGSLKRLGIETIDSCYQHRVDPGIPIEETVGAMAQLVQAGKVRWLRTLGGGSRHPETRKRGPPDYRASVRILTLVS